MKWITPPVSSFLIHSEADSPAGDSPASAQPRRRLQACGLDASELNLELTINLPSPESLPFPQRRSGIKSGDSCKTPVSLLGITHQQTRAHPRHVPETRRRSNVAGRVLLIETLINCRQLQQKKHRCSFFQSVIFPVMTIAWQLVRKPLIWTMVERKVHHLLWASCTCPHVFSFRVSAPYLSNFIHRSIHPFSTTFYPVQG